LVSSSDTDISSKVSTTIEKVKLAVSKTSSTTANGRKLLIELDDLEAKSIEHQATIADITGRIKQRSIQIQAAEGQSQDAPEGNETRQEFLISNYSQAFQIKRKREKKKRRFE